MGVEESAQIFGYYGQNYNANATPFLSVVGLPANNK